MGSLLQPRKEDLILVVVSVSDAGSTRQVSTRLTHMRRGAPRFDNVPMRGTAESSAGKVVVTIATHWNYRMSLHREGNLLLDIGRLGARRAPPFASAAT